MDPRKVLKKALARPQSLRFSEVVEIAEGLGFSLARISGSHHIFVHPGVAELLNLQDVGGKAKAYQVRQVLKLAERYNLVVGGER